MRPILSLLILLSSVSSFATDEFYFPSRSDNPSVGITPQVPVVCEDGNVHRRLHAIDDVKLVELSDDILMSFRSTIIDCWREKGRNHFEIIPQMEDSCRNTNRVRPVVGFPNDGARASGELKHFGGQYSRDVYCDAAILIPKKAILDNYHLKSYHYTYHYFGVTGDYQWMLTFRHNTDQDDYDISLPGSGPAPAVKLSPENTQNIEKWVKTRTWR